MAYSVQGPSVLDEIQEYLNICVQKGMHFYMYIYQIPIYIVI